MPQVYLFSRSFTYFKSKVPSPHLLLPHVATTHKHEGEKKAAMFNTT